MVKKTSVLGLLSVAAALILTLVLLPRGARSAGHPQVPSREHEALIRVSSEQTRILSHDEARHSLPSGASLSSAHTAAQSDVENVELVGHIGGIAWSVAVQGDYAYIGEGPKLTILDVSNPGSPTAAGNTTFFPDAVNDVYVSAPDSEGRTYAYVANQLGGLRVLDVSDAAHPTEIGHRDATRYARSVAVDGQTAFVADGAGLQVVDVSDPANPTEVAYYSTPDWAHGVHVNESKAYIADSEDGLHIVDVSDPLNPTGIGHLDTGGDARGVYVIGEVGYVADASRGLVVVDVSDPASPAELGSYGASTALDVYVNGHTAYLASSGAGLRVLNVSDPAQPIELGGYDTPGTAYGVAFSSGTAYVADGGWGLRVVDVHDPVHPTELGAYVFPGAAWDVAVSGTTAYVTGGPWGLRLVDASDAAHPNEAGSYDTPGQAEAVYVSNEIAYVADFNTLRVVDVSDPAHPTELGYYDSAGNERGVHVNGTRAYVVDVDGDLHVLDVSDPSRPIELGTYDTTEPAVGAADVYVTDEVAYVADGYSGLRAVDVSDPARPTQLGCYDSPGSASAVYVSATTAYLADGSGGGLRAVDVSDPANPTEIGSFDTPGDANDVYVREGIAYVADGYWGLQIVDMRDPVNPSELGCSRTAGYARGVAVSEGLVYVAHRDAGLAILRYTGEVSLYSISGHVRDGTGAPIADVTVSAGTGASASTDASGVYTITELVAGTYVLTANKSGYEFSPSARVVRLPPDSTGQDFTTTPVFGSLTGRITNQVSGAGVANARVSAAGQVARSDVNGHYSLTDLLPGLHNVYVSADGCRDYKGEATIEANTSIVKDVDLTPINVSGYYLPYPGGRRYQCTQGNGGTFSHMGNWHYAFDFGMRDGEQVVASRSGRVVALKDDSNTGCGSRACIDQANYIRVRHADGTDTLYYHLDYESAVVNENDFVSRGDVIAKSDTTGWCTGAHLDFSRHNWGHWKSISVSFADVPGDGVPQTGEWHTSGNYPTSQVVSTSEPTLDTDPPRGSVQLRFTGQPTHTLVLSAFDYITNVSDVRLAATEPGLQTANWFSFTSPMTWTEPAVFAQHRDANGNVSTVVSDTVDAVGYEPLQAAFVVSPTVCVGQGLSLANQTTPFCEQCGWFWDFGDGTTSEEAEPEFDYVAASSSAGYAAPGVYTVTLTAKNATSAALVSHQTEALPTPPANFTLIRSGWTITVEAEATDVAGWSWDFGDGVTATGRIATHTYADPALLSHYPVQLAVEGTNGCTGWSHQYISPYRVYLPIVLRNQ